MKTKILIGLLSTLTIGTTGFAIVENKQINDAKNTIELQSEQLQEKNDNYSKLIEQINNIQEQINKLETKIITLDSDSKTNISDIEEKINNLDSNVSSTNNTINNKINSINNKVSNNEKNINNIANNQKNNIDSRLIGKWKYVSTSQDENGNEIILEKIYEFKNDGTVYIDDVLSGSFSNGMILLDSRPGFKQLCPYNIENNKLILYLAYGMGNTSGIFYRGYETLTKIK